MQNIQVIDIYYNMSETIVVDDRVEDSYNTYLNIQAYCRKKGLADRAAERTAIPYEPNTLFLLWHGASRGCPQTL